VVDVICSATTLPEQLSIPTTPGAKHGPRLAQRGLANILRF
jgi:hypothetical protein